MATEDIYPGEEMFIDYHYPVRHDSNVPDWYKALYEAEVEAWPQPPPPEPNQQGGAGSCGGGGGGQCNRQCSG